MSEPILLGLIAVGLLGGSLAYTLVDWRSSLPFVGSPQDDDDDADDDDHDSDDHDSDDRDDPDEDDEDRD